jgi:hypothetical protein
LFNILKTFKIIEEQFNKHVTSYSKPFQGVWHVKRRFLSNFYKVGLISAEALADHDVLNTCHALVKLLRFKEYSDNFLGGLGCVVPKLLDIIVLSRDGFAWDCKDC